MFKNKRLLSQDHRLLTQTQTARLNFVSLWLKALAVKAYKGKAEISLTEICLIL